MECTLSLVLHSMLRAFGDAIHINAQARYCILISHMFLWSLLDYFKASHYLKSLLNYSQNLYAKSELHSGDLQ